MLSGVAFDTQAATVTESWLRQAGISCGGGLSVEMQGEIDAAVIRRLKIVSIDGEGQYSQSDTEKLLKQFQKEEKRQTYVDYINCLMTLMTMASGTSQLPPREIVLNSSIAVASLETIKRGQRFVMVPGDTVAIKNHGIIFTVESVVKKGAHNTVYFSWSNSNPKAKKSTSSDYQYQAKMIEIEKACVVVPYKADPEKQQVSLISNC